MSAFIVEHEHIDALLTFVQENEVRLYAFNRPELTNANMTLVGRELLSENVRSVCHRYPDATPDAETYTFQRFAIPLTPIEALKASHCLDYQSCEHDEWQESLAYATLQDINRACWTKILHGNAEYDRAPWGIYPEAYKNLTNNSTKRKKRAA